MNVTAQKFQSQYALAVNHRPGGTIGRHSLSFAALSSSLREGAGWGAYHSMCRSENGRFRAIFIAPTKTQKPFPFTIHRGIIW